MFLYQAILLILSLSYCYSVHQVVNVDCDEDTPDETCQGKIIDECVDGSDCIITCKGESICSGTTFRCPIDADCTVKCDSQYGDNPCKHATINATSSHDMNLNVICSNPKSCEYITIDTSLSTNININLTSFNNDATVKHAHNVRHAEIYLPLRGGATYINCIGHSVCESMKIYGNETSFINFELVNRGEHTFKYGYLSFPRDSNINILCNDDNNELNNNNNIQSLEGSSCLGAVFDGRTGENGINSQISIQCFGHVACSRTNISTSGATKSLSISGGHGDNVLSESHIYCPVRSLNLAIDSHINCDIEVIGNGTQMLNSIVIYTQDAFNDLSLTCDYTTSISQNCYSSVDTAPLIYCSLNDSFSVSNDDDEEELSCKLELINVDNNINEWQCSNGFDSSECIDNTINKKDLIELFNILSTFPSFTTTDIDDSIKNIAAFGIWKNKTGQIVLSSIILILIFLSCLICFVNRDSIRDWYKNERTVAGGSSSVRDISINGHNNNNQKNGKKNKIFQKIVIKKQKLKYASLDDDDRDDENLIANNDDDDTSDTDTDSNNNDDNQQMIHIYNDDPISSDEN